MTVSHQIEKSLEITLFHQIEANWVQYPRRPQRPTVQETTVQETATNLEAVGSLDGAIGLRKSIRNRIKSTERKEGCPSYRDTF